MNSSERMKELLLSQFYGKRNIEALLDAVGNELDALDNVREDIRTLIWPDTASGAQLNICGEVVALDRNVVDGLIKEYFGFIEHGDKGFDEAPFRKFFDPTYTSKELSDDDYRLGILAKIAKNNTDCSRESTKNALVKIFNGKCVINNAGNAKVYVGIGRMLSNNDLALIKALNLIIRAAGVGVKLVYMYDEHPFGFSQGGRSQWDGFGVGKFAKMVEENIYGD